MGNLLQQGSQWLGNQLLNFASVTVQLQRGGVAQGFWVAVIGKTSETAVDQLGEITLVKTRDYIGPASQLQLADGTVTLPQPGDRFVEPDGTTFEVTQVPGEGFWRWSDPFRQRIRVHGQQVAAST